MSGWKRNVADWILGFALIALAVIAAMTGLWTAKPNSEEPSKEIVTVVTQPAAPAKDLPDFAPAGRLYRL